MEKLDDELNLSPWGILLFIRRNYLDILSIPHNLALDYSYLSIHFRHLIFFVGFERNCLKKGLSAP